MNVLLLTPDAVGGTFLKQMLSVYMQLHEFDKPVIDVGHAELGLESYYSTTFNQKILRGGSDQSYNKLQSLTEIREILESVDHYKIIKLPHYNINARKDPISEQVPFYHYLNKNYFIIACRRNNVFEHALSWSLNKITKALNVFSADEKISIFTELYHNGITIDPLSVKQALDTYKKYIDWCEDNFRISSYYYYEKNITNIEDYILSLPMFANQKKISTWKDTFGLDATTWNKCHYYLSDVGSLALKKDPKFTQLLQNTNTSLMPVTESDLQQDTHKAWQEFLTDYKSVADPSWPELSSVQDWERLPDHIKSECKNIHNITYHLESVYINQNLIAQEYGAQTHLDLSACLTPIKNCIVNHHSDFLNTHISQYQDASTAIQKMVDLGILTNTVPIKKQTLNEKKSIVKNFDECLDMYNSWIVDHPDIGAQLTKTELLESSNNEQVQWFSNANKQHLLS